MLCIVHSLDSPIAQSVERRTVNPQVVGSNPTRGATFKKLVTRRAFIFLADFRPGHDLIVIRYEDQSISFKNSLVSAKPFLRTSLLFA